jgi:hypothetical protein
MEQTPDRQLGHLHLHGRAHGGGRPVGSYAAAEDAGHDGQQYAGYNGQSPQGDPRGDVEAIELQAGILDKGSNVFLCRGVINKTCMRDARYGLLISWTLQSGSEQVWLILHSQIFKGIVVRDFFACFFFTGNKPTSDADFVLFFRDSYVGIFEYCAVPRNENCSRD